MRCPRCQGTMVEVMLFTKEGGTPMVRCLNCGNRLDKVVIFNRLRALARFSKRPVKKMSRSSTCASSA